MVQPFAARVKKDLQLRGVSLQRASRKDGKPDVVKELMGISSSQLVGAAEPGKMVQVKLEVVDAVCQWGDFNLYDIEEALEEWIRETGSRWPLGYDPLVYKRGSEVRD